jgi:hypothetical protein
MLGDRLEEAKALNRKAVELYQAGRSQEALPLAEEAHRLAVEHGYTALGEQIKAILDKVRSRLSCSICAGKGKIKEQCSHCNGTKMVFDNDKFMEYIQGYPVPVLESVYEEFSKTGPKIKCPSCNGKGYIEKICSACQDEKPMTIEDLEAQIEINDPKYQDFLRISATQEDLKNELQVLLNSMSQCRRWHPQPAEFHKALGAQEDYCDVYHFPCCDKYILVGVAGPPSQYRADGCENCT